MEAVQQKKQGGKGEAVRQKNLKYWLLGAAPKGAQKFSLPNWSDGCGFRIDNM